MASNNIGEVSVSFVADFARFREDTGKAFADLKRSADQGVANLHGLREGFDTVRDAAALFGVGLGIGELTAFIGESIRAAGELTDLAAQVGLTATQLQELQAVARTSGVDADKFAASLEHMTRLAGEAAAGNSGAVDSFNRLKIGVLDANNAIRPSIDLLRQVALAVVAAKTPAEAAKIAFDAFGRSGQSMIPMLQELGEDFDGTREKAHAMGQVMSGETVAASKALTDEWVSFGAEMRAWAAMTATVIEPAFKNLIGWLGDARKAMQDFSITSAPFSWLPTMSFGDAAGPPGQNFHAGTGGGASASGAVPGAAGSHNPATTADINAAVEAAKRQAEAIQKVIDNLAFENKQLGLDSEDQKINTALRQAGVAAASAQGEQIAALVHQGRAHADLLKEMDVEERSRNDLLAEGRDLMASLETPAEKLFDDTARLDQLYAAGAINIDEYNAALVREKAAFAASDPEMKQAAEAAKEYQSTLTDLAGSLGTDLVRAFTDAGSASDRFKNLAVHALQDVLNAVTKLITASITGGSGGTTGGLGSIFGSIAASLFGGSAVLGPLAGSPVAAFAGGGDAGAGQMAIVGEHGPELVQFGAAAHVFPSGTGIRQAGGTTYNIDARGADQAAIARLEATLRELHRSIEPRAVAAVNSERKRGGAFAAAFAR